MTVTVFKSFDGISPAIRTAFSYQKQNNIFASLEWFQLLCEHSMPAKADVRIYHCARDDRPQESCLLVLYQTRKGQFSSLTNCYTMEFAISFSAAEEAREQLIDEIVCAIARERPRWDYANIRFLYAHRPETALLIDAFSRHGFLVNSFFKFENFYASVSGQSFDEYYAQRPSRLRNTINRRQKKLTAAHQFRCHLSDRLDEELAQDYAKIYAASWKDPEEYPQFIEKMCERLAELDVLRIGLLYVDNQPAAAQIWIVSGRKVIIYKLAYDEKFKDFSVGSILTKAMAEKIMSGGGVDEIDYGVGSEPYKAEWMNEKRILIGFEAFNKKTLRGALMAAKWRLGSLIRAVAERRGGLRLPAPQVEEAAR